MLNCQSINLRSPTHRQAPLTIQHSRFTIRQHLPPGIINFRAGYRKPGSTRRDELVSCRRYLLARNVALHRCYISAAIDSPQEP